METNRITKVESIRELVEKWKNYLKEKVILKDEILEEFLSIVALNKISANSGKELPYRGVLLYGHPGTGKTLLMRETENLLKLPENLGETFKVVKIAGPEIISEYYGRTERNLRNRFREAQEISYETGLGIIYIDEIDALAPRRDLSRGELEPRLVGQLLSLMDGLKEFNVFVIASTNRREAIDPALRRPGRFDHEIEIELPDKFLRQAIIKLYCSRYDLSIDIPIINMLAEKTEGYTPADLKHLIREIWRLKQLEKPNDINEIIEKTLRYITPSGLRDFAILRKEYFINFPQEVPQSRCIYTTNEKRVKSMISYLFHHNIIEYAIKHNCVRFLSKYYGETESNIREFFNRIKKYGKIALWLKNIDVFTDEFNHRSAIIEFLEGLENLLERNDTYIFFTGWEKPTWLKCKQL